MVLGAVAVAVALSYLVYRQYRVAARELKRLESVTKSPMLAFFSETLAGYIPMPQRILDIPRYPSTSRPAATVPTCHNACSASLDQQTSRVL